MSWNKFWIYIALSGCVTNPENTQISLTVPTIDDVSYQSNYEKWTQDVHVYHHFDKIYFLTVTKLSNDFLANFRSRYREIYDQDPVALVETKNRTAFFVSIEGPQTELLDISDRNQWSVLLQSKEAKIPPMTIRSLEDKDRWKPFFPSINHWTKEYLLLFDHSSADSGHLLAKTHLNLTLANAQASVILNWDSKEAPPSVE